MRNLSAAAAALVITAGAAATASAGTTFTDTFDQSANTGGWSFNVTTPDVIEESGGNPDEWLRNPGVISFAPIATTTGDSVFTGDYRANQVSQISVDAQTLSSSIGNEGFQFSLLLRDTKGTSMPDDDDYAYFVASETPQPGEGWQNYTFDIPSQSNEDVPAGWSGGYSGDLENFRPGVTWTDVIQNVDRVEFWWLNPSFFALIQDWDVGIDNASITQIPAPGTAGLFGLAALGAASRRRR